MVRSLIFAKRITSFGGVLLMVFVQVAALQIIRPQKAAAATQYRTLADSNPANNSSRWFSLTNYQMQRANINWPQNPNPASCNGRQYRTIPWVPSVDDTALFGSGGALKTGNTINDNTGACSYDKIDAGWCNADAWSGAGCDGAWLDPDAFSWATDSTSALTIGGGSPTAVALNASSKLNNCSSFNSSLGAPARIWGTGTLDNSNHAPALYAANGYAGSPGFNGKSLFSNGVSLFRNNFTLTASQLDEINNASNGLLFQAVADDWLRVYINGIHITDQNNSATATTVTNLPAAVKSSLRVGINNISFQVADKAVWSTDWNNPQRGVGFCYALVLEDNTSDMTCTLTATPNVIAPGGSSTLNWSFTGSPTTATMNWTIGAVTSPGSRVVTPSINSNYILTLTKTGDPGLTCNTIVTIGVSSPRTLGPWDSITNLPPVL